MLKEEIERSICFAQSPESMTIDDQKEQFSFAYVRAVAAVSRIAVSEPTVDDDSVDLLFQQRDGGRSVLSPRLEAQVKCTNASVVTATHVAYPLKMEKLRRSASNQSACSKNSYRCSSAGSIERLGESFREGTCHSQMRILAVPFWRTGGSKCVDTDGSCSKVESIRCRTFERNDATYR
jgi:hypothetical protein